MSQSFAKFRSNLDPIFCYISKHRNQKCFLSIGRYVAKIQGQDRLEILRKTDSISLQKLLPRIPLQFVANGIVGIPGVCIFVADWSQDPIREPALKRTAYFACLVIEKAGFLIIPNKKGCTVMPKQLENPQKIIVITWICFLHYCASWGLEKFPTRKLSKIPLYFFF